jgi:hypothetical protein
MGTGVFYFYLVLNVDFRKKQIEVASKKGITVSRKSICERVKEK